MNRGLIKSMILMLCALATPLLAQITGGTCSNSMLTGVYSLALNGRAISSTGTVTGFYQANGMATFDGAGNVTLTGSVDTNVAQGKSFAYTGAYSVPSNCFGTLSFATTSPATFNLLVFGGGNQYSITGSDSTYVFSGNGGQRPAACNTATLSGEYLYDATGFNLVSTVQPGGASESGTFQFDGQGKVTGSVTSGTYSVAASCLGSATLTDASNATTTLTFSVTGVNGQAFNLIETNSQYSRTGTGHSAFLNPSQSIGNVASYTVGYTPPGSIFVIFGSNLATRTANATTTNLPTTLLNTTVTVNNEAVPLFYVSPTQIDAQMPWDIPAGSVATLVVKNGDSTGNAAAISVPAGGSPGISVYGNNRAVVVNQNGAVNSPTEAAAVGDKVVAYLTGGGPVQASGKLVTGQPAPGGLSPVTGSATITLGTVSAHIDYLGLTPGSIGLYQANFTVPQIAKGTYPLVITIQGVASNSPVMTVSN